MSESVNVSVVQEGDNVKFKAINPSGQEVGQAVVKHKNGKFVIADIGVLVDERGKGVASKITDAIVDHAEENGVTEIGALAAPDYARILDKKGFNLNGLFANLKIKKK